MDDCINRILYEDDINSFKELYNINKKFSIKLIYYFLGNNGTLLLPKEHFCYSCLMYVYCNDFDTFLKIIRYIPRYTQGRWNIMLYFVQLQDPVLTKTIAKHFAERLRKDKTQMFPSCIANFCPSEHSYYNNHFSLTTMVCNELNIDLEKYRKHYIIPLREKLNRVISGTNQRTKSKDLDKLSDKDSDTDNSDIESYKDHDIFEKYIDDYLLNKKTVIDNNLTIKLGEFIKNCKVIIDETQSMELSIYDYKYYPRKSIAKLIQDSSSKSDYYDHVLYITDSPISNTSSINIPELTHYMNICASSETIDRTIQTIHCLNGIILINGCLNNDNILLKYILETNDEVNNVNYLKYKLSNKIYNKIDKLKI